MTTKAISNGDTVLIQTTTLFGSLIVSIFRPDTNTLEMTSGCHRHQYLGAALQALRKYQRERNLPTAPGRVEYW